METVENNAQEKIQLLKTHLDFCEKEIAYLNNAVICLQNEVEQRDKEIESLKISLQKAEIENTASENYIKKCEIQLKEMESQIHVLRQRIKDLIDNSIANMSSQASTQLAQFRNLKQLSETITFLLNSAISSPSMIFTNVENDFRQVISEMEAMNNYFMRVKIPIGGKKDFDIQDQFLDELVETLKNTFTEINLASNRLKQENVTTIAAVARRLLRIHEFASLDNSYSFLVEQRNFHFDNIRFAAEIHHLRSQIEGIPEFYEEIEKEKADVYGNLEDIINRLNFLVTDNQDLSRKNTNLKDDLFAAHTEISDLEEEIENFKAEEYRREIDQDEIEAFRANRRIMSERNRRLNEDLRNKNEKRIKHKTRKRYYKQELRRCHANCGMLEYWRDQLIEQRDGKNQKRIKHKARKRHYKQQIRNMAAAPILPAGNIIGMAGYAPPVFRGLPGDDPETYIRDFRLWCEASPAHNPANGHADRARIHGLFESCMKDYAKDWYEIKVKGKNWELQNISDNINLANLGAINGANNGVIAALAQNQLRGDALAIRNNAVGNAALAGADIIPPHTVWDENWAVSGGRPTDLPVNAPNANNGANVVAPGTRIGQVIQFFLSDFPTVLTGKSKGVFQSITQGTDSVGSFYAKLARMVKYAYPNLPGVARDDIVKEQFISGLSSENQIDARRIGMDLPIGQLLPKLEDIERYRVRIPTQPLSVLPATTPISQGLSSEDVERIISTRLSALPQQSVSRNIPRSAPAQVPASSTPDPSLPPAWRPGMVMVPAAQLEEIEENKLAYSRLQALAVRLGYPANVPDAVENFEDFIHEQLLARLPTNDQYSNNFNIMRTFGNDNYFPRRTFATKSRSSKRRSSRKCSSCGKSGHTKSSCPNDKKRKNKKSKTNYAVDDSTDESSVSSSCSSDSSSSDDDIRVCFGIKKKDSSRTKQKPKKSAVKKKVDRYRIINDVFRLVMKSLAESFSKTVPKETVVSTYSAIDFEFEKLKEPILSLLSGTPSIKTREKIWDSVKEIFIEILQPLRNVVLSNLSSNLILKDKTVYVDDSIFPFDASIGAVSRKFSNDVCTFKTRVIAPGGEKTIVVNKSIFDSGSDSSIVSDNIVKRLEIDVDKYSAPDLRGIATKSGTLGTVYGLEVSVYDNENSLSITDDFLVIKSDKDVILLGMPWITRAGPRVDFKNNIMEFPVSARKYVKVPFSSRKRRTVMNSLNIDTIDLKKMPVNSAPQT